MSAEETGLLDKTRGRSESPARSAVSRVSSSSSFDSGLDAGWGSESSSAYSHCSSARLAGAGGPSSWSWRSVASSSIGSLSPQDSPLLSYTQNTPVLSELKLGETPDKTTFHSSYGVTSGPVKVISFSKSQPFQIYDHQGKVPFSAMFPESYQTTTESFTKENFFKILQMASSYISLMSNFLSIFKHKKTRLGTDPHVGDTGCQFRTGIYLMIWLNLDEIFGDTDKSSDINRRAFKKSLSKAQSSIPSLMASVTSASISKLRQDYPSLSAFLECLGSLKIPSWKVVFLAMSHALSDPGAPLAGKLDESFVAKKLWLQATPRLASELARDMQIKLAKISTDFVLDLAHTFSRDDLSELLNKFKTKDAFNRDILPSYFATQMLNDFLYSLRPAVEIRLKANFFEELRVGPLEVSRTYEQDSFRSGHGYRVSPDYVGPRILLYLEITVPIENSLTFSPEDLVDQADWVVSQGFSQLLLLSTALHPQLKYGLNLEAKPSKKNRLAPPPMFSDLDKLSELEEIEGTDSIPQFTKDLFLFSEAAYFDFKMARDQANALGIGRDAQLRPFFKHVRFVAQGPSAPLRSKESEEALSVFPVNACSPLESL